MKNYKATIGLEIHAELKTKSKMFCSCSNDPFSSDANINICPICLGMPGTLPVLNNKAIEFTIKTGLALNCKIASITKWDRKNYFYPDLPKGYQISQYDLPICQKGFLQVAGRKIKVTRIHLEEDTGTLKHPEGRAEVNYSLADYNRAGVPLMELVTDPDITNAKEAKLFCQNYQQILRTLKIADADMEKGQMRCEANVSVRPLMDADKKISADQRRLNQCKSAPLGTKVEVKNLNSFKSVERAINYEIERQTDVLESGDKVIQETRGWNDKQNKTYVMRVKETSADYRYFPEPDLPPVMIAQQEIDKIKKELPELPEERVKRYIDLDISENDALIITNDVAKAEFFDKLCQILPPELLPLAADWLVNIIKDSVIDEKLFAELLVMTEKGEINRGVAKDILPEIIKGKSPEQIIKEKGLKQISDVGDLQKIIKEIIKQNPAIVESIKKGKTQVIGYLMGQVMQATKGQANPKLVNKIILEALHE